MAHKKGLIPTLGKQALRALLAAVLVFYTAALLSIIFQGWRVQVQVSELRQLIADLKKERDETLVREKEAQSDSSAEGIARQELKMTKPGEQSYVPVPVTGAPRIPPATPTPEGSATPSLPSRVVGWVKELLGIAGP